MTAPTDRPDPRPGLLMHCQHSVGLGHLVRSLALADGLAERFAVTFLSGGPLPDGLAVPPGVDVVAMPALGLDAGSQLVSRDDRWTVQEACALRVDLVLDTLRRTRPVAVVVELYPFGRKKFAFELGPLLEAVHAAPAPRPAVVVSLRDILVGSRRDQQRHDDRASATTNRYVDEVLVHGDPGFARLEEFFHPTLPLEVPVTYTGFVVPGTGDDATMRARREGTGTVAPRVLVSAGGGLVGEPLLRAAALAAPAVHAAHGLTTTLVTGPFMPDGDVRGLEELARATPHLEVLRFVRDLAGEMATSAVSVSQAGYNTTMDLLRAGVPAVVVPYAAGREDEQAERSRRLARVGALDVVDADDLTPASLTAAVGAALRRTASDRGVEGLALDGRRRSAEVVAALCRRRGLLGGRPGGIEAAGIEAAGIEADVRIAPAEVVGAGTAP